MSTDAIIDVIVSEVIAIVIPQILETLRSITGT